LALVVEREDNWYDKKSHAVDVCRPGVRGDVLLQEGAYFLAGEILTHGKRRALERSVSMGPRPEQKDLR